MYPFKYWYSGVQRQTRSFPGWSPGSEEQRRSQIGKAEKRRKKEEMIEEGRERGRKGAAEKINRKGKGHIKKENTARK